MVVCDRCKDIFVAGAIRGKKAAFFSKTAQEPATDDKT